MRPPAAPSHRARSASARRRQPRGLAQPRRHVLVGVHQALADRRAQPAAGQSLQSRRQCRARSPSSVPWSCRRGAARRREPRRGAQRRRRVRRLERPHPRAQPVHQREVVGQPAEERLAEMQVGLDEAGQDDRAGGIDDAVVRLRRRSVRPRRCVRRGSTRRLRPRLPRRSSSGSCRGGRAATSDRAAFAAAHCIDRPETCGSSILPRRTAISSARMATAISSGETAPMSKPTGARRPEPVRARRRPRAAPR